MPLRSDIFAPDGQVDPNSELAKRTRREAEYGSMYEDALGTLKPPQMGAKYMQGPEGKLWQGIEQQQAFGAAQAGRRGFNPFAARGAAQSGAELGSQGYGAAAGIREQQEAYRRKAEAALLQQRTAQDFTQAGIETGQLGSKLSQQDWEDTQKRQLDAEEKARIRAREDAAMETTGQILQAIGNVASDERMKENIMPAGSRADALMELLGSASPTAGMSREDAARYYNTPIGASADNAQMVGEFGNKKNPRRALVYVGNQPRNGGPELERQLLAQADELDDGGPDLERRLIAQADEPDDSREALMAPMRGIAITPSGEGGPDNAIGYGTPVLSPERRRRAEEALGIPQRIDPRAAGQIAREMPRSYAPANASGKAGRDGVTMAPLEVRSQMTPERRRRAEEALGIPQRIDPRAATQIMREMPRSSNFINAGSEADRTGRAVRRADGVIEMPTQILQESAEDALRRREADRRAAIMLESLNGQASADESRAARPAAARGAELADMLDEHAAQFSKKLGGKIVDNALDNTVPYSFNYRPGMGQQPGEQLGTMAQDLQRSPLTNAMVTPTPRGLAINPAKAVGPIVAMVGRLGERVKKVERR